MSHDPVEFDSIGQAYAQELGDLVDSYLVAVRGQPLDPVAYRLMLAEMLARSLATDVPAEHEVTVFADFIRVVTRRTNANRQRLQGRGLPRPDRRPAI
jgi:hypothetical protein